MTPESSGGGSLSVPSVLEYFKRHLKMLPSPSTSVPISALIPVPSPPTSNPGAGSVRPSLRSTSPSLVRPPSAQKRSGTHSFGLSPSRSTEILGDKDREREKEREGGNRGGRGGREGEGEYTGSTRPMSAESRGPWVDKRSTLNSSSRAGTGRWTGLDSESAPDPLGRSGESIRNSPTRIDLEVPQEVSE